MTAPYDGLAHLARLAGHVRGVRDCDVPALLVLTDPNRTPDPVQLASRLPEGTGLIYRHFGARNRFKIAAQLADHAHERRFVLLIAADPQLAAQVNAHGVHWPERHLSQCASRRARMDGRIFTASAHSPISVKRAAAAGANAVIYSTLFPSHSPSANRPMGPFAGAAVAQATPIPIHALGGVNARTAKRLVGLGFTGIACVEAAIRSAR